MIETVAAQPNTLRAEVLETANAAIHGDRNLHYGTPTENFERIAALWNVYLSRKFRTGFSVAPSDVAQMMVLLKVGRGMNSLTQDTAVDIAGYAACAWEAYNSETP